MDVYGAGWLPEHRGEAACSPEEMNPVVGLSIPWWRRTLDCVVKGRRRRPRLPRESADARGPHNLQGWLKSPPPPAHHMSVRHPLVPQLQKEQQYGCCFVAEAVKAGDKESASCAKRRSSAVTTPSSSKSNLLPSCFTPAWPAEGVLVASSWLAGLGRTGMQRSGPPHGDAEKQATAAVLAERERGRPNRPDDLGGEQG